MMRRFYAPPETFRDGEINLNAEETKHLRGVLRLDKGDEISVFDGAGREFFCRIESVEKSLSRLRILHETAAKFPESNLNLTLAAALLKNEKFDLVVQKAVELGVVKIIPVQTKRCDVKLKDAGKRLERWRKIIVEAAKQSGRATLMTIDEPRDFDKFIETAGGTKLLFAERGGASFSAIEAGGEITAAVGAEGGWEDSEIEAARRKGFKIITFGGRILRAETAAITIAGILQHRFGDLN